MSKAKRFSMAILMMLVLLVLTSCGGPEHTYKQAQELLSKGEYSAAAEKFESLGSYEDAATLTMYCKACALCESGNFEAGIAGFESLGNYKDCSLRISYYTARSWDDKSVGTTEFEWMERAKSIYNENPLYLDSAERITALDARIVTVKKTLYDNAVKELEDRQYDAAITTFERLGDYCDSAEQAAIARRQYQLEELNKATVGSYITFGSFEQDYNTSNGTEPIEWLVLDKEDNRLLVISRYSLATKSYNRYDYVTWETCSLRKWLNNDFLQSAFTSTEQAMIPMVTVAADKNPNFSTNPGNATRDKIFLLSVAEANKYFSSDSARRCVPTMYARMTNAYVDNGHCEWWLRSPASEQCKAAQIQPDGRVAGDLVQALSCTVRPAMWINLD